MQVTFCIINYNLNAWFGGQSAYLQLWIKNIYLIWITVTCKINNTQCRPRALTINHTRTVQIFLFLSTHVEDQQVAELSVLLVRHLQGALGLGVGRRSVFLSLPIHWLRLLGLCCCCVWKIHTTILRSSKMLKTAATLRHWAAAVSKNRCSKTATLGTVLCLKNPNCHPDIIRIAQKMWKGVPMSSDPDLLSQVHTFPLQTLKIFFLKIKITTLMRCSTILHHMRYVYSIHFLVQILRYCHIMIIIQLLIIRPSTAAYLVILLVGEIQASQFDSREVIV